MVIRAAKYSCYLKSRVVWDCSSNKGDRFHLKLNISGKPIAKKYCEGKVKRTLKRELKVLEIVKREANENDYCDQVRSFFERANQRRVNIHSSTRFGDS